VEEGKVEATSLQLRVSLSYRPAGDLTHAIVDGVLARLRATEPTPYRHWFPTQASDECDLWWELGTADPFVALQKTEAIFQASLFPTLDALGKTLQVVRFVIYPKDDPVAANNWGW
jgi:hypothetical protein